MKTSESLNVKRIALIAALFFVPLIGFSQEDQGDENAKALEEIKQTFGEVPSFFEAFPEHAVAGAWEYFQELNSDETLIPPKYKQLMQLAVAAQIPCDYCIYYHTASAKNHGATEEEIKEAVAHGAETRHWSMILQGNQVDLDEFKEEFDKMMDHMARETGN
jgi:AhpD family alkylhydroperoxidase